MEKVKIFVIKYTKEFGIFLPLSAFNVLFQTLLC